MQICITYTQQFRAAFLEGSFLTWLKWWNDVNCAAVLTSELFDYGLDVVQPNLWGKKTQEGFKGIYFSSDSEVVFSSFISLLSFDGSETPGQSSPPRWGSCGSTPGPTTPCPRLFAVNRGKTVTKASSWDNCHLRFSVGAEYPVLSRQHDLTDIHILLKTKDIWPSGDPTGKTVTERSSDKQKSPRFSACLSLLPEWNRSQPGHPVTTVTDDGVTAPCPPEPDYDIIQYKFQSQASPKTVNVTSSRRGNTITKWRAILQSLLNSIPVDAEIAAIAGMLKFNRQNTPGDIEKI